MLTQHVKADANTSFPVTMDPDWIGIAKCVGAISLAAGSVIVPGGIVARLITKVGSLKKAATILYRLLKSKKYADKLKSLKSLSLGLGANLIGIGMIASNCG